MALSAKFFGGHSPQCTRYSPLNMNFFSVNFSAPILAMRFSNGTEVVLSIDSPSFLRSGDRPVDRSEHQPLERKASNIGLSQKSRQNKQWG